MTNSGRSGASFSPGVELRAILDGVAEGITVQAADGRLVWANDAAATMCGFADARALLDAPLDQVFAQFEILDEQGAPVALEQLPGRRVMRGEPQAEALLRTRVRATGEDLWRVVKARPVPDTQSARGLVVNTFYDVTERKRAEEAQGLLAEVTAVLFSSLDYAAGLQRVADALVPRLADLCSVRVVQREGGWPERVAAAHVHPAQRELADEIDHRRPLTAAAAFPAAPHGEALVMRTGASELVAEISDARLVAAAQDDAETLRLLRALGLRSSMVVTLVYGGRVFGTLTLALTRGGRRYGRSDLALAEELGRRAGMAVENARLHRAARDALRDREELLAIVSHDLKNPLGAVLMSAGVMLRWSAGAEDGRLRRHAELIQAMAQRMDWLVGSLLDAASLEAGHFSIDYEPHAPAALVEEAVDALQPLAAEKSLRLERLVDPALPAELLCDRRRLFQVFSNLIGNAIKFTPAGGRITVRAEAQRGEVRFSVSDTGPGIPTEQLPHLFDRFWQGNPTGREGTGLGLYIAKGIVEAHGGRIWVDSQPGEGGTFTFALPLDPPADEP
ncbi:MAG TPA: PAS domain-containing sensor histidine kinase [Myxococcota bacterium]|jgi:PAS domain S-box-containing protein|nr:PAS domain-containing sensor histidine kinase [Myxococcota bacterium]